MKYFFLIFSLFLAGTTIVAQKLEVSENDKYLVMEKGDPFFWMADTVWELFHHCDREQAQMYLEKKAEQEFNVVQAVALAEIDGLNTLNPYGETPLLNNNPETPNRKYLEHMDYIIKKADSFGIYVAL